MYVLDACRLSGFTNTCGSTVTTPCLVCLVFLSKVEVAAIETELLRDYRFGQQQLIEIWGHACAIAITKVCITPLVQYPSVFEYNINTYMCTVYELCIASIIHCPFSPQIPTISVGVSHISIHPYFKQFLMRVL